MLQNLKYVVNRNRIEIKQKKLGNNMNLRRINTGYVDRVMPPSLNASPTMRIHAQDDTHVWSTFF